MKLLAKTLAIAAAAVAATTTSTVSAQFDADATIPFAEEPPMAGPDADIAFIDEPGYTDANATRSLDFDDLQDPIADEAITTTTDESQGEGQGRELAVVMGVIAGFQIAAAASPIIAQIAAGRKKECQQVACWISTNSRTCALSVAEKVQADMMKGRDRYRSESVKANGMWVRYWRTKFEPADRGDIATGKCSNGNAFKVTNCQSTGRVKC